MPPLNSPTDIADALSAPLGDLIAAVGRGVAEAQQALDETTIETFKKIYSSKNYQALADLGYQPTWYRIPEVNAEIAVSLSISGEVEPVTPNQGGRSSKLKLYAAPVDANYTNKYDYDFKAASVIRCKIVPVPPSPQAANIKVVPNVSGMTYAQAKRLLQEMDIPFKLATLQVAEPADTALLKGSLPEAGEILSPGRHVELLLTD